MTEEHAPYTPSVRTGLEVDSTPMDHAELRKLRELAGWTQAEFAQRLGITINHYARIERGDPREGEIRPITLTIAILARLIVKLKKGG